jgi:quercetin dioxygenase-like cupin family protein
MPRMKKTTLALAVSLAGGLFVAGVAVGKTTVEPKFVTVDEAKWTDLGGGPKLAGVVGDPMKGGYTGLMTLPAGFTSPLHTHTGAYEALMIKGTTSHWLKGEDGTKAKKLTAGSYWSMPGKLEHVSACDKGSECMFVVWQKGKFDFNMAKEAAAPKTEPAKAEPAKPAPAKAEPAKKM